MKEYLTVALFQQDIIWENPAANRDLLSSSLMNIPASADLIIFPEMFTTGFTMNATEVAEDMNGPTVNWMFKESQLRKAVISGSIIIEEAGNYFNRLLWVTPHGQIMYYDKKHLFTLAKEDFTFTAGERREIFELNGWRVCPLICYDLRFPELSRNRLDYDLLIYVANFPAKRAYPWKQLLVARAIENQAYTIGANRIGQDGMKIAYSGNSMIIDFQGEILQETQQKNQWISHTINKNSLHAFRRAYPFLKDQEM